MPTTPRTAPRFLLFVLLTLVAGSAALAQPSGKAAQGRKQFLLVVGGSHFSTMSLGQAQYREALAQLFSLR